MPGTWQFGHHHVVRPSSPCARFEVRRPQRGQTGRPYTRQGALPPYRSAAASHPADAA
jgi:hypothetical protein